MTNEKKVTRVAFFCLMVIASIFMIGALYGKEFHISFKLKDIIQAVFNSSEGLEVETEFEVTNQTGECINGIVYSDEDVHNLELLVYCEAAFEPRDCQVAIVATVLNRVQSGKFGETISDIIFAPKQFSAVENNIFYSENTPISYEQIAEWEDIDSIKQAVLAGLNGEDPTEELGGYGAYYYSKECISSEVKNITIGNYIYFNEWHKEEFYD